MNIIFVLFIFIVIFVKNFKEFYYFSVTYLYFRPEKRSEKYDSKVSVLPYLLLTNVVNGMLAFYF